MKFFFHPSFGKSFLVSLILLSIFLAWELGLTPIPSPPRIEPSQTEVVFSILLALGLALNFGLFAYQKAHNTCNLGARRASTVGGTVGIIALLCPVCLLLPATIFGAGLSLAFLSPWLPILRVVALFLLVASTILLWPKR